MEPTFFFMTALRLLFNCCTIYICTLDVCNIGYVEVSNNFSLIFSTTFRCKVTELASNALQIRIVPSRGQDHRIMVLLSVSTQA